MSKIPLIFLILVVISGILTVGYFWTRSLISNNPTYAQKLDSGTFASSLRLVREVDPETKKLIRQYYVLDTQNNSSTDFFNCKFTLVSKGDQKKYDAFFNDYTLKNCKVFSEVQPHYDCTLTNKLNEWLHYNSSRNKDKFLSHATTTIAMGRFYEGQTTTATAYLTQNALSDIYSVDLNCKIKNGRAVTHSQTF